MNKVLHALLVSTRAALIAILIAAATLLIMYLVTYGEYGDDGALTKSRIPYYINGSLVAAIGTFLITFLSFWEWARIKKAWNNYWDIFGTDDIFAAFGFILILVVLVPLFTIGLSEANVIHLPKYIKAEVIVWVLLSIAFLFGTFGRGSGLLFSIVSTTIICTLSSSIFDLPLLFLTITIGAIAGFLVNRFVYFLFIKKWKFQEDQGKI